MDFATVALAMLLLPGQVAKSPSDVDLRCGAYCLYVALGALDLKPSSFADLEQRLGQPSALGYSMQQLDESARSFSAYTLGVETSLDNLERRSGRFACIALLEGRGHYVCILDLDAKNVYLIDPPNQQTVSRDAFAALWNGKAILLSDRPIDPRIPERFPWLAVMAGFATLAAGVVLWVFFKKRRG